ncbi:hypothetical protein RO3G_06743 [Rhizopus delemar RA 99-880]|uniref:Retrotransposon gag domain-containing protein n=1 Tax=Rhizopus delemar (strain RA 99-880 / ATCC MYA-4621 / FGSC 9543 / NRRL 43880) TaxID=246409 RepID=I1C0Q8_RHIO9|nr:hypothetical protein RO3G_06743 [Rhizopus delemar RA 99-880]|eukprot:EIE82038.1 hypothetical protein RO3G_06743 [Rhizopus delemar RA 99-880]
MENPKQEDRPMELGATDMEIEQVDQDPSLTEDGSEETPIENANVQEITSDHDDIDAEVSKLIRYKKEESARLYQKYIMAGEEEKADLAFQKMRKYGAQLLTLSGKLVSPAINPVKKEIGLRLTQNDIPKFQLTSWPDIPFPGEKCYESVEHFLRSFEKVIYSAALDIQEVWRRYLPVSLAFDHDDWVEKDLKRCDTWTSARIVFTNKFLTDNARTDAMHRLFTMTMNKHESISSYMTRFLSTCIEAGANKNDPMVAARFKASFSEPVLEKCKTAFVLKENKNVPWTVERAAEIARNLLGDCGIGVLFLSINKSNKISRKIDESLEPLY